MKHSFIVLTIALASACGTQQEPATRIEYIEQPATTTPASQTLSTSQDGNAVTNAVSASPLPVEPAASPTPTPVESATPTPAPTLEANSTPQDANSASQQVMPIQNPSPTPSASPAPSCAPYDPNGNAVFTCGTWTISDAPNNPAGCGANQAAIWSWANRTDSDSIDPRTGALTHNNVIYNPASHEGAYWRYVFANGSHGAQVQITCYQSILADTD